jgi:hypothetical protein
VRVVAAGAASGESAHDAFVSAWTTYGGEAAGEDETGDLLLRMTAAQCVVDEPRVRPFVSVRVRLTVAAAHSAGGGTVWSAAREVAALGVDEREAGDRAMQEAARALARAAAEELPARMWSSARVTER